MVRLLLVLVSVSIALSGLVTAEDPIPVNGRLGSDLLLPLGEACTSKRPYRFDLLRDTEMIGVYVPNDDLEGLRSYKDRLTYDKETCTITLKELRTQDGNRFTAQLNCDINHRSIPHNINYLVTFIDPTTSGPSTPAMNYTREDRTSRNGTQVSHDGVLRFISFCLSLDSVVNAALGLLLLILQESRWDWMINKLDARRVNVASKMNYIITALTEFCSICIMHSGFSYTLILCVIPIILFADTVRSCGFLDCFLSHSLICFRKIFFCCSCCSDDLCSRCKRIAWFLWSAFMLLIQVLFAVVVGLLSFGDSSRIDSFRIGYLILSPVLSLILHCGVSTITYHCYKATFDNVPPDDPTKTSDDPEKETSL